MLIYGIEFPTDNEVRNIEVQNNLEEALLNLRMHYDFIYEGIKNGLIHPDYATQSLGRLTWKMENDEEWF